MHSSKLQESVKLSEVGDASSSGPAGAQHLTCLYVSPEAVKRVRAGEDALENGKTHCVAIFVVNPLGMRR